MKKILKRIRKMIESKKLEKEAEVKTESPAANETRKEIPFRVIDKDGMRIVISHDDVEPELLSSEVVQNLSEGYGINRTIHQQSGRGELETEAI